mmetsp:Transcript_33095/g.53013  ORF Transcript_33095/g.53013 Transcript_33095/m.53013 type:complete len:518 (+) Transcript_33095:72-1625(+)
MDALAWAPLVPYAILIPLSLYGDVKLYLNRHKIYVQKRSSLMLTFHLSLMYCMLSTLFAHVSSVYFTQFHLYLNLLAAIFGLLFVLNVRNWMIYYQYFWTHHTMQYHLDVIRTRTFTKSRHKNNWFILNKTTFGSLRYVVKLYGSATFILLVFALIVLLVVIQITNRVLQALASSTVLVFVLLYCLSYAVIVKKTPSFNDRWYIHRESKLHAKILLSGIMAVLFCTLVANSIAEAAEIGMITNCLVLLAMWSSLNFTSTIWVLRRNEAMEQEPANAEQQEQLNAPGVSQTHRFGSNSSTFVIADAACITVEMMLSEEHAFNAFLMYLAKEFAIENLLFFIEVNNYQKYLLVEHPIDICSRQKEQHLLELPSFVPESGIIAHQSQAIWIHSENMDAETHIDELYHEKRCAYDIYKKYIREECEMEINISGEMRDSITQSIGHYARLLNNSMTPNELFLVFKDCKDEVYQLMLFSLNRFKIDEEFEEIKDMFCYSSSNTRITPSGTGSLEIDLRHKLQL